MYYPSFSRVAAVEETEPLSSDTPAGSQIAIVDPVTERIPGSKSLHRYLYRNRRRESRQPAMSMHEDDYIPPIDQDQYDELEEQIREDAGLPDDDDDDEN